MVLNSMEKWCLKWDQFDQNIREYFKTLRDEQNLFDVTLATEDGHQIQAHKIILSAGSNFFCDIFLKSNYTNMLVYLKWIRKVELELVIEFLYNGQAVITHEELNMFLDTGKELQVKGLQGLEQETNHYDIGSANSQENDQIECLVINNPEEIRPQKNNGMGDSNLVLDTNSELDNQIEGMIEKYENLWKCKVCEKTSKQKGNIKNHVEMHIEGMSHACKICGKTFPNRLGVQVHISNIHTQLMACEVCGKADMNKLTYRSHKRRYH